MPVDKDDALATFKLRGIPAVIAVILFAAGSIATSVFLKKDVSSNEKVRSEIKMSLMSEIAGDITADSKAIQDALDRGDKAAAAKISEGLQKRKVEVGDLAMKGSGDDIIIKASYSVYGPNGVENKVGYFRFSYSAITGWRYRNDTTVVSWYLKFF